MIEVESGVPIPKNGVNKYPWDDMEINDSFFVPDGNLAAIRSASVQAGRRKGNRFTVRHVDGGVRVWRVE